MIATACVFGLVLVGWRPIALPRLVAQNRAHGAPSMGLVRRLRSRGAADDRRTLPLILELLARELRAGSTVPGALRSIAGADPAAASLVPVVDRIDRGARVGDELDRWAGELRSSDAHLARAVLRLGISTGAALADSLDRVAETIRDRVELDAELRALTAQSRTSATVLAVAPAIFLGVLALADPTMLAPLVTTPLGWMCLGAGLSLDLVGFWWMRRLVVGIDR